MLKGALAGKFDLDAEVDHRIMYGRDKVVWKAHRVARGVTQTVIAVIDYEVGESRKYIDENFNLLRVNESVWVGTSRRARNVIAVVFDPNIEAFLEALGYRVSASGRLKSRSACEELRKAGVLEDPRLREAVEEIAERLAELFEKLH
jgi:hypothetical protein